MGRSRSKLLKRAVAAPAADHHAPLLDRPDHLADDPRMPDEGPEPIPNGRLKRVAKLVPRRPPLDLNQASSRLRQQLDRVRATPTAGAARERHDRDSRTSALKLVPNSRTRDQLVPTRPQASGVNR